MNCLDNLKGFLRGLGSEPVLLLNFVPWRIGIDQKREYRLARAPRRIHLEPRDGALPVAAQLPWRDVTVSVAHDADYGIGVRRHPHAFARRLAG